LADERYRGRLPLFGGIDKARFRRQVVPGETLELAVSMDQLGASAGRGTGTASVAGEVACRVGMLFVIARG
jgi:3-hydroxyacyl-[acyl-carrier-protein] dehydratase